MMDRNTGIGKLTRVEDELAWTSWDKNCICRFYCWQRRNISVCFGRQLTGDYLGGKSDGTKCSIWIE